MRLTTDDPNRRRSELPERASDANGTLEKVIRDQAVAIALLQRDVEELRKARDVWGNRLWTLLVAAAAAAAGYYLRTRT